MEAPTPNTTNQQKKITFSLKDKKYNFTFSILKNDLIINCEFSEQNQIFEETFSYESITNINRYFLMYESIIDIMNELYEFIKDNQIEISKDNSNLVIIFKLPNKKFKEANFTLKNKMNITNDEIKLLKQTIAEQKLEIEDLKKRLLNLENWKNGITGGNEINNKLNNLSIIKDSKIFSNINQVQFIEKGILKSDMLKNKKISFKLIYQATRDRDSISDFYNKCNGITHVLLILMTDKALIFGGYTDLAFIFDSKGATEYIDNNAFVFSMDKQKIYPVKIGGNAIRCCYCCCPQFYQNTIYLNNNFLKGNNSQTCTSKEGNYIGFNSDYELNDGIQCFKVSELEVFQIKFSL